MHRENATSPAQENAKGRGNGQQVTIAEEAYVFGFPLLLMETTRNVQTAVAKAGYRKAPLNQFVHVPVFPDSTFTAVVSPNADTLYSSAWLDLKVEPMVLSVPEMGKRYYLMQMLDGWTNAFAVPGTRTTGNHKGDFAIVGPQWKGKLPDGIKVFQSPTNMVWIIGRTQTNGKADYAAVRALQKQYKLVPLSAWGRPYTPPDNVPIDRDVDLKSRPVDQVFGLDARTFFSRLNALMVDNPPAAADAKALARFATIGISPGRPFDLKQFDPVTAAALEHSVRATPAKIAADARHPQSKPVNGWRSMPDNTAEFGTDYNSRAAVALVGLGANLKADAVYLRATVDSEERPLEGRNRYQIHFEKSQLPPVNAFWSVTMYNEKQAFVANSINRYAIGDRDKLQFGEDGSLTLFLQHDSPGPDKESNWLPAPTGNFNLILRLYWPKQEIIDGAWQPAGVRQVGE